MAGDAGTYPLRYDVAYPDRLSRLLIFVKWLLAVPHFLILGVLGNLQGVLTLIAFFAILFTRRYPRALFDLYVNVGRWAANAWAYVGLLRDEYPPFGWEPGRYPLTYEVAYPERLSRLLIFVKWLLALPHYFVLFFLYALAFVAAVAAWIAILLTARYPRSLFDFMVGVTRWTLRLGAYLALLRDEYPPFSLR